MHDKFHVLIIGGGVAGPALALFLKKARISSAVYEAYGPGGEIGGGLGLAPNGMNVLAVLGLADTLTRRVTSSLGLVQFGKQVMQVEWVGEHLQ
jgi:2-polyprenyl-6-methoxyphenol hydroxylase-like FAD-dependent oxidoreductase